MAYCIPHPPIDPWQLAATAFIVGLVTMFAVGCIILMIVDPPDA